MKKLITMMAMALLLLTACNSGISTELSITELNKVPKEIQKVDYVFDIQHYVEVMNDEKGPSYLVINTSGNVTVSVEGDNDTLKILINDDEPQENVGIQTHLYKIETDRDYEILRVYKNGQEISIDVNSGI